MRLSQCPCATALAGSHTASPQPVAPPGITLFYSAVLKALIACGLFLATARQPAAASDWPQFMRDAAHSGDAADEALTLPLGLLAQIKLDDAVMTSPAVVGGLAYVVDQMGTAYCVDPKAGKIVWKISPEGEKAMGSNTSSPCVAKGRVYYGTTAGNFHILDAKDGKVIKSLRLGSPIVSAPTLANENIYFQALDAVVRCLDLDGNEKWNWDHYKRYQEPPEVTKKEEPARGHPGSYDRPHYGGGEVAVAGTQVVTNIGWDLLCLEDKGKAAELAWCRRCPAGRDGAIPISSSISAGFVHTGGQGADGVIALLRFNLKDGTTATGGPGSLPYPWSTPAARGAAVTTRSNHDYLDGIHLYDCETKKVLASWRDDKSATPVISSHALAKGHVLATTLTGELLAFELNPGPGAKPFRVKLPNGKGSGSSPAVSGGCVYFGCDDAYLYVFGAGGALGLKKDEQPAVHEPRSKLVPATGKAYGWNSTAANSANTSFVDDPVLHAPFRLRWAARAFGHFKTPCIATEDGDLLSVTLQRTVTCQEQSTGRLRWRMRLPPETAERVNSAGILAAGGKVYVPCPRSYSGGGISAQPGTLFCLDQKTGATLWSAEIGSKGVWQRFSPVLAAGKVAYSTVSPKGTFIQAWDAQTGKSAWQVELSVTKGVGAGAEGCALGEVMYFNAGAEAWGWKPEGAGKRGEAVAIDAKTGDVLWKTNENFGDTYPVLAGERLLLNEHAAGLFCLTAKDGKLAWKTGQNGCSRLSIGPDYFVTRGYGGHAGRYRLEDGKEYPLTGKGGNLGGEYHACGAVALTPNLSVNVTVAGLHVRDAKSGALLWRSPGFAPRGCVNPALANGRVFWPSAASGMLFCWEPEEKKP